MAHVPKLRVGETGQENLCTQCGEWWPADNDFFYSQPDGVAGLFYMCKACYAERYNEVRAKRAAAEYQSSVQTPALHATSEGQ